MAAGPVSRLGSFEPGDKTGLRLSPHLAPSTKGVGWLDAKFLHRCKNVQNRVLFVHRLCDPDRRAR